MELIYNRKFQYSWCIHYILLFKGNQKFSRKNKTSNWTPSLYQQKTPVKIWGKQHHFLPPTSKAAMLWLAIWQTIWVSDKFSSSLEHKRSASDFVIRSHELAVLGMILAFLNMSSCSGVQVYKSICNSSKAAYMDGKLIWSKTLFKICGKQHLFSPPATRAAMFWLAIWVSDNLTWTVTSYSFLSENWIFTSFSNSLLITTKEEFSVSFPSEAIVTFEELSLMKDVTYSFNNCMYRLSAAS